MDNRENLRSMLNNLINDKQEEASLDLHNYLTAKMRDVAGISTASTSTDIDDTDDVGDVTAGDGDAGDDVDTDDN